MIEDYKFHTQLSSALYGSIWLANGKNNHIEYAIKEMKLSAMQNNCSVKDQIYIVEDGFLERKLNRLVVSKLPKNECIVKLISDFEENGSIHLVFEYCPCGDLLNIIQQKGKLCPTQANKFFQNIVSGVRDLHNLIGYAHRDLSLENVLIDKDGQAKLCDFGLVAAVDTLTSTIVGKSLYMAPEVHSGEQYIPRFADSWSLGIILAIMLTGIPPFKVASPSDRRFRLVKTKGIGALFRFWGIEKSVPPIALDLLSKLLAFHPHDRLDIDGILNHPWVLKNRK